VHHFTLPEHTSRANLGEEEHNGLSFAPKAKKKPPSHRVVFYKRFYEKKKTRMSSCKTLAQKICEQKAALQEDDDLFDRILRALQVVKSKVETTV
jgi:hypothetical protein